jgi:hypothetical protein
MTWESALQTIFATVVGAAGALLGDWLPALIIATLLLGPFMHPRTRPLAFGFLDWLRRRGIDTAAVLDRMYSYALPVRLKAWLITALVSAGLGWVAQLAATAILDGEFHGSAVLLFTLATALACGMFLGGLLSVMKTRQVPTSRDVRLAVTNPQGFDAFLRTFGEPSSPMVGLVALFAGATLLGVAHGYYIAAAGANAIGFRVCGGAIGIMTMLGAGIAFQVIIYAITKFGALTLTFFARPVAAVGRAGLVLAIPGLTRDNEEAVLGAATSFEQLAGYVPYVLTIGALGLAHIGLGLAFGVPLMVVTSGLTLIVGIGLYLGHAFKSPALGATFSVLVGSVFTGGALWRTGADGYWRTMSNFGVLHGFAFLAAFVGCVLVAVLMGAFVRWAFSMILPKGRIIGVAHVEAGHGAYRAGHVASEHVIHVPSPWALRFGWLAAIAVMLLISPILFGWMRRVMYPAPPTPMEAHANERLNQANEHNIERTGEAIARTIERASDDLVPRTPDERRRERLQQAQDHLADDQNEAAARRLEEQGSRLLGRRHSGHGRRRTSRSTCVTYTGPGPCNGMCVDFVNANPAQCR